jgi:hypothetical protein
MSSMRQGLLIWISASAALMVLGSFGPWVKVFAMSASGIDGHNDGWLVVAAAALAVLLFFLRRDSRAGGVWALLGGLAGTAITFHDRLKVSSAISDGGELVQAAAQVGWGLNVALLGSVSLTIAGLVWVAKSEAATESEPEVLEHARPAAPTGPAAGWYADPGDPLQLRYWTGSAWTEHTAPAPS